MNPSGRAALSFDPDGANKSLAEHRWIALSPITAPIPFSRTIHLMNTRCDVRLWSGCRPIGPIQVNVIINRYQVHRQRY